ncbi:hypothetical protein EK21DRAFT_113309 [Setomelanomma holmii]|uniref:Uncharacterized protein n=1 Tax=Setomelanomma holmii TaxID=210430 RepID=A0A9P4LLX5_9PLEO|nr:hypothetical protein EK21DRAFT_113309 [Setomelanomma holmii]
MSTTASPSTVGDGDLHETTLMHALPVSVNTVSDPINSESFLLRIVLEILSFTYLHELEIALFDSVHYPELMTTVTRKGKRMGERSFLPYHEKAITSSLGNTFAYTCAWFHRDQLPHHEGHRSLIDYIIRPSQRLGVDPAYFSDKIMEYYDHRCRPGLEKETILYKDTSRLFGIFSKKWTNGAQHRVLADRLTADFYVVRKLCLGQVAEVIFHRAIFKFAAKHSKYDIVAVSLRVYANPTTTAVAHALMQQWRRHLFERQGQASSNGLPSQNSSSARMNAPKKAPAPAEAKTARNKNTNNHNTNTNTNTTSNSSGSSLDLSTVEHELRPANQRRDPERGDLNIQRALKNRLPVPVVDAKPRTTLIQARLNPAKARSV